MIKGTLKFGWFEKLKILLGAKAYIQIDLSNAAAMIGEVAFRPPVWMNK